MEGFINIGDSDTKEFYVPNSFRTQYDTERPRKLGKGGYGTVIFLKSKIGEVNIAVKRFDGTFEKAKIAQRCFRELQLLRQLKHENIVKMKFVHTTDKSTLNSVYLTEEYCGCNLVWWLTQQSEAVHFTLRCFQKMVSELLRALKYLHSANVLHRDLTPSNIAISKLGKLTLIDFGLARVKKELMTNGPGITYYRPIETIDFDNSNNPRRYDEKTDIWSLGAILCEMLTGAILFKIGDKETQSDGETLQNAINICGAIPERVLERIDNKDARVRLQKKSTDAKRIDFLEKFRTDARDWLKDDIGRNGDHLRDFINRTLAWDAQDRLSVDEALAHPFLAVVREQEKEVNAEIEPIPDVGNDRTTIEQWKEHICNIIRQCPVRFDACADR